MNIEDLYEKAQTYNGLYVSFPLVVKMQAMGSSFTTIATDKMRRLTVVNPRFEKRREELDAIYNSTDVDVRLMEKFDTLDEAISDYRQREVVANVSKAKEYALGDFTVDELLEEIRDRT